MTIRNYRPRRTERGSVSRNQAFLLYLGIFGVIGLQIAYPLIHGNALREVTLATVFVGAATMVLHSYLAHGPLFATLFTIITLL